MPRLGPKRANEVFSVAFVVFVAGEDEDCLDDAADAFSGRG
jgi:hypothetical protein